MFWNGVATPLQFLIRMVRYGVHVKHMTRDYAATVKNFIFNHGPHLAQPKRIAIETYMMKNQYESYAGDMQRDKWYYNYWVTVNDLGRIFDTMSKFESQKEMEQFCRDQLKNIKDTPQVLTLPSPLPLAQQSTPVHLPQPTQQTQSSINDSHSSQIIQMENGNHNFQWHQHQPQQLLQEVIRTQQIHSRILSDILLKLNSISSASGNNSTQCTQVQPGTNLLSALSYSYSLKPCLISSCV